MKKLIASAAVILVPVGVAVGVSSTRERHQNDWRKIHPGSCSVRLPDGGVEVLMTNDTMECLAGKRRVK